MDYYLQNYFIYKNIPYLCTKEKIFQKYAHKMIKDFNFYRLVLCSEKMPKCRLVIWWLNRMATRF